MYLSDLFICWKPADTNDAFRIDLHIKLLVPMRQIRQSVAIDGEIHMTSLEPLTVMTVMCIKWVAIQHRL